MQPPSLGEPPPSYRYGSLESLFSPARPYFCFAARHVERRRLNDDFPGEIQYPAETQNIAPASSASKRRPYKAIETDCSHAVQQRVASRPAGGPCCSSPEGGQGTEPGAARQGSRR